MSGWLRAVSSVPHLRSRIVGRTTEMWMENCFEDITIAFSVLTRLLFKMTYLLLYTNIA